MRLNKDKVYIDSTKKTNNAILRVIFSPSLKQIFALHQYSDHIMIYNPDCSLNRIIRPQSLSLKNTIILDLCWSEKQKRLAATFKDQLLCFWDAIDWKFEKVFVGVSEHSKIYFLNSID